MPLNSGINYATMGRMEGKGTRMTPAAKRRIKKVFGRADLIALVAKETDNSHDNVAVILDSIINAIITNLGEDNTVRITGFGTFTIRTRPGRTTTLPHRKNRPIYLPPRRIVKFTLSKRLRDTLNDE